MLILASSVSKWTSKNEYKECLIGMQKNLESIYSLIT